MRYQAFILLSIASVVGNCCLHAESLAEIAAKQKKSRKAGERKVFTEKDLQEARGATASLNVAQPSEESPASATFSASDTAGQGDSDMDKLNAKIEAWRRRYAPVESEIARLEKEIKELEEEVSRTTTPVEFIPFGRQSEHSPIKLKAERARERLPVARRELAQARKRLDAIEESARKEGVSSGQLSR
jgi:predicted RNase H-like nuclease (RuvC/YqgF family)